VPKSELDLANLKAVRDSPIPKYEDDNVSEDHMTKVILVPKHAMGRVIGKGGRMLKALGIASSCKLEFNRSGETVDGKTPLHITSTIGNTSDLDAVCEEVESIVSNKGPKFLKKFPIKYCVLNYFIHFEIL